MSRTSLLRNFRFYGNSPRPEGAGESPRSRDYCELPAPFALAGRAVALRKGGSYMPLMPSALYNRDILRLAVSIPHHQRLQDPEASIEKRSAVCGSRVAVDVVLDGEGRVARLGQDVKACALGQASASLMGAAAIGRSGDELADARDRLAAYLDGRREDPGDWPGLSIFSEARAYKARHPSILLAFEAIAEAARKASLLRLRAGQI